MLPPTTPVQTQTERPISAIFLHALMILAALGGVCISLLAPRFRAIFRDLLGERPLPLLTVFVLRFYPLLLLLACAFAATIYLAWRYGRAPAPRLITVALTVFVMAQIALTTCAFFLPLIGIIQSLSPAP